MLGVGWDLVRWHLEGMYGSVEEGLDKDDVKVIRVRNILVKGDKVHPLITPDRLWVLSMSNTLRNTNSRLSGTRPQVTT